MNNDDINLPVTADDKGSVPQDPALEAQPSHISFAQQQAIQSMIACQHAANKALTADQILTELHNAFTVDGDGEHVLFTQMQILDSLFGRLLTKALTALDYKDQPIPDYLNNGRVLLALRTQTQCRMAIETLAVLKERKSRQKDENYEQTEGL